MVGAACFLCSASLQSTMLVHLLIFLFCCAVPLEAGIVAKSSITQCVGSHDVKANSGEPCSKMLVVALTITGDEVCHIIDDNSYAVIFVLQGKSRYMEADVSKVVDNSNPMKAKNVQLKYPIRIRVRKSPVLIHFDMHKVAVSWAEMVISCDHCYDIIQTFSHHPYEIMRKKKKCRADWFAKDRQLGCGRQYTPTGHKIFDSQVNLL